MKDIYKLVLVFVCFLIVLNYNKYDLRKKKKNNDISLQKKMRGGNLIENINNKTRYFKIKENSIDSLPKIIILDENGETRLVEDNKKMVDIPNKSIWELKFNDISDAYNIMNTSASTPFTLAYQIITDISSQGAVMPTKIEYKLELIRNKNVFNIYFEDFGETKKGKMYLLINKTDNTLIAKSEKEINDSQQKIKKGEFLIEPYRLNLFKKNNEFITHYENFVNYFNYEIFNLMFSIKFKHISIPEIYEYKNNNNKLTNNSDQYNIYSTNWIAGPNFSPTAVTGKFRGDGKVDIQNKDLYQKEDTRQLVIYEKNNSKSKGTMDKDNVSTLWNIKYNSGDVTEKTYEITNKGGKTWSLLNNIIENSKKFFEGSTKTLYTKELKPIEKKIYLENIPDEDDHYNILFNLLLDTGVEKKMYLSTSNWDGMVVAREVTDRFTLLIKKQNAFIIKLNEDDTRTLENINIKKKLLGLSDDEMNDIIPGSVDTSKIGRNKYLKIGHGISRDYINNILYEKYYEQFNFTDKETILKKISENNICLETQLKYPNLLDSFISVEKLKIVNILNFT